MLIRGKVIDVHRGGGRQGTRRWGGGTKMERRLKFSLPLVAHWTTMFWFCQSQYVIVSSSGFSVMLSTSVTSSVQ